MESTQINARIEFLECLRRMPAGNIFWMGDRDQVVDGLEIAGKSLIKDITWDDDENLFNITLSNNHKLKLYLSNDRHIIGECSCRDRTANNICAHFISAIASLKKAIEPGTFAMMNFSGTYQNFLRSGLDSMITQKKVPTESRPAGRTSYKLVVEYSNGLIHINLRRNGANISPFEPGTPERLRDFLIQRSNQHDPQFIENFFRYFGGIYPVICKKGDIETEVTLDMDIVYTSFVQLDYTGNRIVISKVLDQGKVFDEKLFATDNHVYDLERQTIVRIAGNEGWKRYWQSFDDITKNRRSSESGGKEEIRPGATVVTTSVDVFNQWQFRINDTKREEFLFYSRFCVDGNEEVLHHDLSPSYRLSIKEAGDGRVNIRTEGLSAGMPFSLSSKAMAIFSAGAYENSTACLKKRGRLSAVYDAYFAALDYNTTHRRESEINRHLKVDIFSRSEMRSDAKKFLLHYLREADKREILLLAQDGRWRVVHIDIKAQAGLFDILYKIFGVEICSRELSPGLINIPTGALTERLSALYKNLSERGIGLIYNDRPVVMVNWDFVFNAGRTSMDWFEISPEIRCDGQIVDDDDFEKALISGGIFLDDASIKILDEESSRKLSLVSSVRGKQKSDIVQIPRLRILDWIMLRREGIQLNLSDEDERIMESLLSFEKIQKHPLPDGLNAELRHYQIDGYDWLAFLYEHRFGGCLADDMGLGKTIQTITLLAALKEGKIRSRHDRDKPHLIVVPPSLLFNWENEIARFYPDMKVKTYRGKERSVDFSGTDIVLSSFDIIRRDIDKLSETYFHVVIFDEAQAVKNIQAETTSAARRLKGDFKLALTGTPVENHLGEYYSIMELAVPGLLSDYEGYNGKREDKDGVSISRIAQRTKPFVLRRTKQLIADELPPKVETNIYLELTPHQKALYNRTVQEVKKRVDDAYRENTVGRARIIALTAILKLRQICLSSRLLLRDSREKSPKIDFLLEQLIELRDEGHSALVFSQFTSFLDIVEEEMLAKGLNYSRLDGSTHVSKRKKIVEGFQASTEPSVLLMSLKAGGRGLNLTRASYVFHLDPWWNPAVENQASDRAHRLGQASRVTITRLVMRHTVEEKMMALKEVKLKLYNALFEGKITEAGSLLSKEDFYFLLD